MFHKNRIILFNKDIFYIKKFTLLVFFVISCGVSFSQPDTTAIKDSIFINNNTEISPADTIVNDSTNTTLKFSPDAIEDSIAYSATDSMLIDLENQKVYIHGSGHIENPEMILDADYITIDMDKSTLFASGVTDTTGQETGRPEIVQGGKEFKAGTLKYSFKTSEGIITDVITEESGGYIHGATQKLHANKHIHIFDGKYTTCDLDHPHFYIELTKAKIIPGEKIVSGPMYFVIADVPLPIILPFGLIPNQDNRKTGILIPKYGEEQRRGFFLQDGGYYWAINDYLDAALTGEIYTQGGWGLGMHSNFKKRYKYSGNFDLKYNKNIFGEKGIEGYSNSSTFWVASQYTQDSKANPTSNFSMQLDFGSSKHNEVNAVTIDQFAKNTTSSSISYRKTWPGKPFNFSANMNGTQNTSEKTVDLNMPTLAFNVNRQFPFKRKSGAGKSKWYEKIGYTVNTSFKNTLNTYDSLLFETESFSQMRNGLKYDVPVSTSLKILKFVNVTPSARFNGRAYFDYIEKKEGFELDTVSGGFKSIVLTDTLSGLKAPFDFSFSVPFATKMYGFYNFSKGPVTKIRHVVSPGISLNWRPDFSEKKWNYYDYVPGDTTFTQKYSFYDTGIYGKPPTGKSGSVGFRLGNNFEMKVKSRNDSLPEDKKVKLLETLNFSTNYNIAADSLRWANITMSGGTRLFDQITVNFGANFDPYILDSLGKRINTFELKENGKIARFNTGKISLSGSLNRDKFKKENSKKEVSPVTNYYPYPEIAYNDCVIPWDFKIKYNINYKKRFKTDLQKFEGDITQTLGLDGHFSLTDKWKISARADYDFVVKKITYSSINIHRDLHCWEMTFFVVPFGTLRSYNFRINIKSSVFQGLEYKKQKNWHDN